MSEDNDVLRRIIEDRPPVPPQDEQAHRTLTRFYEGKRNKCMAYLTGWVLFSIVLINMGLFMMIWAENPRLTFLGLFVAIAGLETSVLVKLWYWVIDNKISTVKALKQTQLLLLRQTGGLGAGTLEAPSPVGRDLLKLDESFWERIDPATMRTVSKTAITAAAVLMAILLVLAALLTPHL